MKLLVAARLSRMADGQTGLETQDAGSVAWAAREGHEIVHVAADRKSGTSAPWDRPNLKPWVTEAGKIASYDGILAYRFDRLSRGDDESTSAIEDWARQNGKILLTEDGLQYPCEGVEGIRWDVTKRIAHEEWLKTSERYRRMQKFLKDSGFLVGRPCFGFRVVGLGDHKTLAADPVNAEYVRQAVARYLSGDSLRAVCAWLESEGVKPNSKTGQSWSAVSLAQVFRNESLIGRRKDAAGRTILKFEPVINRETWNKLQAKMNTKANRKGIAPSNTAMLTSIAVCAKCERPMYRVKSGNKRKDGTKYSIAYYRCHGDDRTPSKCKNMVPLAELDAWTDAWITSEGIGTKKIMETISFPGQGYDDEIAEVERDIHELDLDDTEYDGKLAALRSERARLKSLPAQATRTDSYETNVTVADHWATLDDAGKRDYLIRAGIRIRAERGSYRAEGDQSKLAGLLAG